MQAMKEDGVFQYFNVVGLVCAEVGRVIQLGSRWCINFLGQPYKVPQTKLGSLTQQEFILCSPS